MTQERIQSFFGELEKIAFEGSFLKSPIAKQLVTEHKALRAAKGVVIPQRKPSPLLAAARASRSAPPTSEQRMLDRLKANMQKPSGAKPAADADRAAAAGRGYGRAITSVE